MLDLFLELCSIPSPSGQERAVTDRVGEELTALGLQWDEDDTAAVLEGTAGSIYCRVPGENGHGDPIFLCAHTDTVPLDGRLEPFVEDGVVRNAGGTILGSDNKAAVVVMLEAVRRIVKEGRRTRASSWSSRRRRRWASRAPQRSTTAGWWRDTGFVYDQGAPIGEIVLGSPHAYTLDLRFHGRAAHAGMVPEEGRSAIAAAVPRDRRLPAGPARRRDERERRCDHRRNGA